MPLRRLLQPLIDKAHGRIKFFKRPKTRDEVENTRETLSKVYFCLTALALVAVTVFVGVTVPLHTAEEALQARKSTGTARIIKFEGFKKTKDYIYTIPSDVNDSETQPNEPKSETQIS